MPDFVHHEMFPLGPDATAYRHLTSDHVGTASLAGVRPGGAPVRLVVPDEAIPSAWIAGRVELPDGQLVEELRVVLTLKTDGTWANGASETTAGEFELGRRFRGPRCALR